MTSEKKIQANRRNAEQSTGPRTANGKNRARGNAVKNGLYARSMLIKNEDHKAYHALQKQFFEEYPPAGPTQKTVLQLIVDDAWRLHRFRLIEAEKLKEQNDILENPMHRLELAMDADDPGCVLLKAYVPSNNSAPMEEIARQRKNTIRDFFTNCEALWAIQGRRKVVKTEKLDSTGEQNPTTKDLDVLS